MNVILGLHVTETKNRQIQRHFCSVNFFKYFHDAKKCLHSGWVPPGSQSLFTTGLAISALSKMTAPQMPLPGDFTPNERFYWLPILPCASSLVFLPIHTWEGVLDKWWLPNMFLQVFHNWLHDWIYP